MTKYSLLDWQQHTLVELGGIFANIFEYEQPGEIAARLETIARELRSCFSAALPPDEQAFLEGDIDRAMQQLQAIKQSHSKYFPGQEG